MSVTGPVGFIASGAAVGVKQSRAPDLALVASETGPISGAAVFTTNLAAAAPVQVSRQHLKSTGGRVAAVVLNSGCANAATGEEGLLAARATAEGVAQALSLARDKLVANEEVLVCSTGLIGPQLPIDRVLGGIPALVADLGASRSHGQRAAEAIMTTDTHPKEVLLELDGVTFGGMVKGAGMIGPNMATMLAVLTTDAIASPHELSRALGEAVSDTFNQLIVDGCTSTNDTVIALSSGRVEPRSREALTDGLREACAGLADQLAEDAEGTTKVVRVIVRNAMSAEDARLAARRVASSLLVKTSLFGADPYWGRILSELGSSGAAFSLDRVVLSYGDTVVFSKGSQAAFDHDQVSSYLSASRVEINADLGLGDARAAVLSTDLGHGYIEENMRTS